MHQIFPYQNFGKKKKTPWLWWFDFLILFICDISSFLYLCSGFYLGWVQSTKWMIEKEEDGCSDGGGIVKQVPLLLLQPFFHLGCSSHTHKRKKLFDSRTWTPVINQFERDSYQQWMHFNLFWRWTLLCTHKVVGG